MTETESKLPKRLVRIQKDKKIAGVCTGFGAYFNVDPVMARVVAIALALLCGGGILLYLIAWIVMPLEEHV